MPSNPKQQSADDAAPQFECLAYSIEDAALIASIGRTALYAEIKAGRLCARKVGKRTVILADDLRAWLASLPKLGKAA